MEYDFTNPYELARFIKESKKSTPIKAYVSGDLRNCEFNDIEDFSNQNLHILFGESKNIYNFLEKNKDKINKYKLEVDRRNSAIPLLNITNESARIEPGAIIRDKVSIGHNAVIMMGAVINIGSEIGEETMVDMNAVIGARAKVGKRVHVGAGAVIAGVLEPPSKSPCEIGNDVLIGANSVILEGVKVGNGSIIAAGSVVIDNIPSNVVVAGSPAKIIKKVDQNTMKKTEILNDLRK